MTQAPERPSLDTSKSSSSLSSSSSSVTSPVTIVDNRNGVTPTTSPITNSTRRKTNAQKTQKPLSSPLVKWFYDLSIRKKQLLVFLGVQSLLTIVLLLVGAFETVGSGRKQLVNQSESELKATEVNYGIKIDQMGFGFRGQSDNSAIIEAALANTNGQSLTAQERAVVKQILQNEIKARNIEYATLVGVNKRIIVNANNDRTGEVFDPNNLVSQVINNPQQIKTSEIISWQDIKKESPPVLSELTANEDVLVRNTVTPVFRPNTQEIIGVLVSGDVIGQTKNTIVETTVAEFDGGYNAIYLAEGENNFRLLTARGENENQTDEGIVNDRLLQLALENPNEIVSARDQVVDTKYTLTAQAILNNENNPIGVLVRGTSESNLRQIIANALKTQAQVALLLFVISVFIIILMSRTIADRIESLQKTTAKFADGQYDSRANIIGEDEVGDLAVTFNYLADNILKNESLLLLDANQAALFQQITGAQTIDEDDINRVFNNTLSEAKEILAIDRLVIYRFKPDWSGYISNEAGEDDLPSALEEEINDPCIPFELRQAYVNGRIFATENVYQAGFAPEHEGLMHRLQIKSNLVVPIISQGKLFGLLIAHHCRQHHTWENREKAFLEQLSVRYGVILDRVNLLKNQIKATIKAEQLKDVTTTLAVTLEREEVLSSTVKAVRSALECDRTIVYEFDNDWTGTIVAESVAPGYPKAIGSTIKDPCFADKYVARYEQGRVQSTPDIDKAGLTDCHLQQLRPFKVKANLVAPILVNGKLIALLICHQCSSARYWQPEEIDLYTQISTQVGLALERIRLSDLQQKSETEQREGRLLLQQRALELLMQVDPVSQGDLTIRATVTEDEIGTIADSYNATIENLRAIVTQVQSTALQVTQTTTNRQQEVDLLQTEISGQVLNISEALEKVNVMNNSSKIVAQSAQQAEQALAQAQETVEMGEGAMNSTVKSITNIRGTVQQATEQMRRLGDTTENISNVVGLISRFAAQTHLLALKASIEAARAGEQGQGFAVIADEVRSLATQSARATADIEKLVSDILTETKTVVLAMEEGSDLVIEGSGLVEETRKSLTKITSITLQVNELVESIALAAFEQSENSEEVKTKITDVAQVALKTNLSVNQLSESFIELRGLANQLESNVSQFKVN